MLLEEDEMEAGLHMNSTAADGWRGAINKPLEDKKNSCA
jgi:hypothetical protein